jgi:large subunit ribosomal protein L10
MEVKKLANEKIIKQKEEEVDKLAEKMKDASIVLLTDYRGINVADVTELRKNLRNVNAEYCVIKNNITKRALNKLGISELDETLVGPTAVIIAQEEYLPALKAIYSYAKEHDFYKMKAGVLEGKVTSIEELTTLAQLPSREELIAKLAGCLLANVSKLAATLDAVRAKKEETAE